MPLSLSAGDQRGELGSESPGPRMDVRKSSESGLGRTFWRGRGEEDTCLFQLLWANPTLCLREEAAFLPGRLRNDSGTVTAGEMRTGVPGLRLHSVEVGCWTLGGVCPLSARPLTPTRRTVQPLVRGCGEGCQLPRPASGATGASCTCALPSAAAGRASGHPHLLLRGEAPALSQLYIPQDAILPVKQQVKEFHTVQGTHGAGRGRHLQHGERERAWSYLFMCTHMHAHATPSSFPAKCDFRSGAGSGLCESA